MAQNLAIRGSISRAVLAIYKVPIIQKTRQLIVMMLKVTGSQAKLNLRQVAAPQMTNPMINMPIPPVFCLA